MQDHRAQGGRDNPSADPRWRHQLAMAVPPQTIWLMVDLMAGAGAGELSMRSPDEGGLYLLSVELEDLARK
jgi:hypothetical protein